MQRRNTLRHLAAALAAAVSLPVNTKAGEAPGTPRIHTVDIQDFGFSPALLEVREGDTVNWVNHDIVPHTATALDGSWDTGSLAQGQSMTITVSENTSAKYFCRFHPAMRGQLKVETMN